MRKNNWVFVLGFLRMLTLLAGSVAGTWFPTFFRGYGYFELFSGIEDRVVVLTIVSIVMAIAAAILFSASLIISKILRISLFQSAFRNFAIGYIYSVVCMNLGNPILDQLAKIGVGIEVGFLVLSIVIFSILVFIEYRFFTIYPRS